MLGHRAVFELADLCDAEIAQDKMALRAEIDVGRLHVAVDETSRTQVDERVAKIHPEVHRAYMRHGVVAQVVDQRFALLGQKIHVVADGVFLRHDLIAAVTGQIWA